jgi:hypothetical protein
MCLPKLCPGRIREIQYVLIAVSQVKKAPLPNWDIFRETPPSLDTGSAVKNELYIRGEKLAKVLAYLLAFAIVLVSSIVSKGSIIFIIQQLDPAQDLGYCWPQDTSEAGGGSWANNTGNFQVSGGLGKGWGKVLL